MGAKLSKELGANLDEELSEGMGANKDEEIRAKFSFEVT